MGAVSGSTKPAGDVPPPRVSAGMSTGISTGMSAGLSTGLSTGSSAGMSEPMASGRHGGLPLGSVHVGAVQGGAPLLQSDAASHPHASRLADLVDRLAGEVVLRHAPGRIALDLGHGAPAVTEWVRARAAALTVIDGVDLGRGASIRLPWQDGRFELIYSLRTVPHLGHDAPSSDLATRSLLAELARVLAPGGTALVQIDNPRSLWGAYYGLRNAANMIEKGALVVPSERGVTRFDTLPRFVGMLPDGLVMTDVHGLRVFTALPQTLALPIVGRLLARLEWYVRDRPPWRTFGAHLLVVLHRPALASAPAMLPAQKAES